ncbi:MAG: hypothetical protein LBF27_11530 [Sphingobacterium sp.]|nr:hypothetical protein [Sphingobacterium sp.]
MKNLNGIISVSWVIRSYYLLSDEMKADTVYNHKNLAHECIDDTTSNLILDRAISLPLEIEKGLADFLLITDKKNRQEADMRGKHFLVRSYSLDPTCLRICIR